MPEGTPRVSRRVELSTGALLWCVGALYVALGMAVRTMGFVEPNDTARIVQRAVPDFVQGKYQIYSWGEDGRGVRRDGTPVSAVAPGLGIRNGYPPGGTLLFVPGYYAARAARLSREDTIVWAALPCILGEVLCAWALVRIARRGGTVALFPWPALGALAFVRAAVVWQDSIFRGHWEGLMAFCVLQAYWYHARRPWLAGAWAGAALLLKTTTLVALGPLGLALLIEAWRSKRWGPLVLFALFGAAVFLPPLVPYLRHDPDGVWQALVKFPAAIALHEGSLWWMLLRALGHTPHDAAFLHLRFYTTPALFMLLGGLSLVVLTRGRPERRQQDLLGLMAFGAVGLFAMGKIPNAWYAVMGTAFVLAWCASVGTSTAWAWGIGFVLVQDAVVTGAPAQFTGAALTLWATLAWIAIGVYLLRSVRISDAQPTPDAAPVA